MTMKKKLTAKDIENLENTSPVSALAAGVDQISPTCPTWADCCSLPCATGSTVCPTCAFCPTE